jgi:acyl-coenzyme A synthetase/AMP-(fatty) acid ligase
MTTLLARVAAAIAEDGQRSGMPGSWHAAARVLDYPQLLQLARQRRQEHPQLRHRSLALEYHDVLDFCVALLAFDGWCSDLWLVAPGLAPAMRAEYGQQLACAFNWRDGHLEEAAEVTPSVAWPVSADAAVTTATRWWLATSGTSGSPKLIGHTLDSLVEQIRISTFSRSLRWGLVYQPCRFAGLQVVLQALLSAATLVDAQGPEPDQRIEAMVAGQVDALSATPSLWRALLMTGRLQQLPLRQVTLGGEIVDQALLDWLRRLFPEAKLLHIYASTEAGVGFTVADGRAGFPVAWLDADASPSPVLLRVDAQQHLQVRPRLLAHADVVTARTGADGYLDTEDLVRIEGDRVLFLGRAGGVINVGGNKVHPEQVEQVILAVPGVLQARVYGKRSSMVGQLVTADVVAADPSRQASLQVAVMKHCLQQLARYQIPVKLNWVNAIQTGDAGKMTRN